MLHRWKSGVVWALDLFDRDWVYEKPPIGVSENQGP